VPTHRVIFVLALALAGPVSPAAPAGSEFWDDRPLRIVQTSQMSFPPALAAEGVNEGEVRVVLNVDAAGRLVDYLVTGYTDRALADEWAFHVRDWSFEPARQRGVPVGTRGEVVFSFQARGLVVSLRPNDAAAFSANGLISPTLTSLLCRPSELDEPVRALRIVEPQHPGSRETARSIRPTVLVDFYIDPEGRPRMPVIVRATDESYASAAVDALLQWQFSSPARHGRSVIVRATQLFTFNGNNR
jgi:TonB family protein